MLSSVKRTLVIALCQIYYPFSALYEVQIDFHFLLRNLEFEFPLRFPKTEQATGNCCKTLSVSSRRTKVMSAPNLRFYCFSSTVSRLLLALTMALLSSS